MQCSNDNNWSRRAFLHLLPLAAVAATPGATHALKSGEVHSELSELMAKFPGAGSADTYYPSFFLGDWTVQRDLYEVKKLAGFSDLRAPGHSMLSEAGLQQVRKSIGVRANFPLRFMRFREHVVEERATGINGEVGVQAGARRNTQVAWNVDNPNVLTATWGASNGREVRVLRRAFVDAPQGMGTFVCSEYARVGDVQGEGSRLGFGRPPSFYGRRRIAKYVVTSVDQERMPNGMGRVVVEYIYPPDAAAMEKAVLVLKYRDFLTRKSKSKVPVDDAES